MKTLSWTGVLPVLLATTIGSPAFGSSAPLELARASVCQQAWLPTFGSTPGVGFIADAATVFDDGDGAALYVGGYFTSAGGVDANRIATWDGTSWSALGGGVTGNPVVGVGVFALTTFDDGNGVALYAGGSFTHANGVAASNVAKWNGSSWSPLGTGTNGYVRALAVFDDGSGPALYAGGDFTACGNAAASRIAKWNGATWTSVGRGTSDAVHALAVFDDGGGDALYAGGFFTAAGGTTANRVAKWDGRIWSSLSTGMNGEVRALTVFDNGNGPALYAGGNFGTAGGASAGHVAKWSGSSWSPLGTGLFGNQLTGGPPVYALTVFDDGGGSALYAGGELEGAGSVSAYRVAKWNGASWSALGDGMIDAYSDVRMLAVYDDGGGAELYAGGDFTTAESAEMNYLSKWNGASWRPVGNGLSHFVFALAEYDDGNGTALYAGGSFQHIGDTPTQRIAKWDGASWSPLGSGMSGWFATVFALAVFDDGGGSALYAGGAFDGPGARIAKWNGTIWSPLGTGMNGLVMALAVFDDGSGPALYAAGQFTTAGGVSANRIAKWNGTSWTPLGSGLTGINSFAGAYALAVFDDGGGPALYAGGDFTTAGGVSANRMAKWNGSAWSAVGAGINSTVVSLTVFDGSLVAGSYPMLENSSIRKWNGSSWSSLGSGIFGQVTALTAYDDGSGTALYAGGNFIEAGGVPATYIAKWNGSSWSALGSGVNAAVRALHGFDDGIAPALYAGGDFSRALDSGDGFLAKWTCDTIAPVLECRSLVVADQPLGPPGTIVHFPLLADDNADPEPDVVCVPPSGSFFPRGTTLVNCTATDMSGNQSTCQFTVTVVPKVQATATGK